MAYARHLLPTLLGFPALWGSSARQSMLSRRELSVVLQSALFLLASQAAFAQTSSHYHVDAHVNVLANYNDSENTWLNGGLGRYAYRSDSQSTSGGLEANLEYRYKPNSAFQFRSFMQAQGVSHASSVRELGIVELEARYRFNVGFHHQFSVKAGQFFLPISLENTDRFWESPYTLNFSSLNSWIGEEFRPIGIDGQYRYHFEQGETVTAGLTTFGGNDSMGALLAYRGWSYGRLRTAYGDVLSLPELEPLSDTGLFSGQRDDGTKPFGRDLDNRPGYALRLGYLSDRLALSAAWVDNRGDTELHRGEYAWRTKFAVLGASWFASPQLELLAEASQGQSKMGALPGVDIDFYSAYGMASYTFEDYRVSYRYDLFGVDDRDQMDDENHDFGRSHTLALIWTAANDKYQVGGELLYLDSERDRTLEDLSVHEDQHSWSLSALFKYRL